MRVDWECSVPRHEGQIEWIECHACDFVSGARRAAKASGMKADGTIFLGQPALDMGAHTMPRDARRAGGRVPPAAESFQAVLLLLLVLVSS